jgi:HD-GYP domain-containing protein (c-di-GMP phosphodiesterase class II)
MADGVGLDRLEPVAIEELENQEDHYAEHLADVNEDQEVVSSEDICNVHGVVLVRKGARIDHDMAQRILRHKLTKPLDQQVQISDGLGGESLGDHAERLLDKYTDLRRMHEALGFASAWQELTEGIAVPPLLWQKLTVLHHQMPEEFEKSLFCAWLASLIAREMKCNDGQLASAYFAGLCHDLGLMHIDPAILRKRGPLEAHEWRAIQSHVVVGKLIMENTNGIGADVPQAILEHHERCDGTGYPVGKGQRQLGTLGQVVGMADSLQAIRVKQFEQVGRRLFDARPYLQLNAHTYSYPVFQAMDAILRKSGGEATTVNPYGNYENLVGSLDGRARCLQRIVGDLDGVVDDLRACANRARGKDLLRALEHVRAMILSSGMLREELLSWLEDLKEGPNPDALGELVEMDLMFNELRWQLKNLFNAFTLYYDRVGETADGGCTPVKHVMEELVADLMSGGFK